jgi:hypothetical protein
MYLNHRGNKLNNELQYGAHLTRWDWSPSVGCTAFVWLVADLISTTTDYLHHSRQ